MVHVEQCTRKMEYNVLILHNSFEKVLNTGCNISLPQKSCHPISFHLLNK